MVTDAERARFEREVQVLAALDHPNIVQVIDRGELDDGASFLVMSYVSGKPLRKWITSYYQRQPDGPPPSDPTELLRVFLKIADAVNAAHLRGIVHRDLKPANILVDDHDEPHVLDFGLARPGVGDSSGGEVTITGQFVGSLPWASPEQAEGDSARIDTRTDVYALGVIFYQMLTNGRFPYAVVGNMAQVLNNIISAEPKPPSVALSETRAADTAKLAKARRFTTHHASPVNPIIEAIVLKALSKQRDDRYQNAGELSRDITNYLSGKPTIAFGNPPAPALWPKLTGAAAVVAVLALAVAGTWWLARHDADAPPVAEEPAIAGPADIDIDGPGDMPPTPPVVEDTPPTSPAAPSPLAHEPLTVNEMHAALKAANPDYTGEGRFVVRDGWIVEAQIDGANLVDLSPLAYTRLEVLIARENQISNLSPLRGLSLTHVVFSNNAITDLAPLADAPLEHLVLVRNRVADLGPLRGLPLQLLSLGYNDVTDLEPLTSLGLSDNHIRDLSPLEDMPLEYLDIRHDPDITDLSPLRGMPIEELRLRRQRVRDVEPIADLPVRRLRVDNEQAPAIIGALLAAGNDTLTSLHIEGSLTDLSFLDGLALQELTFSGSELEQGLDALRNMTSLETIEDRDRDVGPMPAEALWAMIDDES